MGTLEKKGPKPPIQLLQLLKNSPREVKETIFFIYCVLPDPSQEIKLMGRGLKAERKIPPVSPAMCMSVVFLAPWHENTRKLGTEVTTIPLLPHPSSAVPTSAPPVPRKIPFCYLIFMLIYSGLFQEVGHCHGTISTPAPHQGVLP